MIDRDCALHITRQASLLGIRRGAMSCQSRPISEADEALMRRIDELHPEPPFVGARMLRQHLQGQGVLGGRHHIGPRMQRMSIEALAPQPGTSQRAPGHKISRTRCASWPLPNPTRSGRWTRPTLRWRAASSISARWWTRPDAGCWRTRLPPYGRPFTPRRSSGRRPARWGVPNDVNTDQGCQLSMEGRVAWGNNVFVERVWRSLK